MIGNNFAYKNALKKFIFLFKLKLNFEPVAVHPMCWKININVFLKALEIYLFVLTLNKYSIRVVFPDPFSPIIAMLYKN